MWELSSNSTHSEPAIPRCSGSTSAGVHSSYRPEVISVGTRISPSLSITSQSFSVPVTVNSFGPHIVS